jgi:ubiquitin-like protein Pup
VSDTGRIIGRSGDRDRAEEQVPPHGGTAGAAARPLLDDLDGLLEEIDEVLEVNAEEFVRGYVQKGGE